MTVTISSVPIGSGSFGFGENTLTSLRLSFWAMVEGRCFNPFWLQLNSIKCRNTPISARRMNR